MHGSGKEPYSADGEHVTTESAEQSKAGTKQAADPGVHQDEGSPSLDASAAAVADAVAARVRRECAAQGVPEKVEDPVILAKVATLAYEGLATPSRRP
jgi:hypothetical protein